jgi:diacylglycerol kinase family enzyme
MRALLVVNTFATTTNLQIQAEVSKILSEAFDLTVVNTSSRNDAISIAHDATGYEIIIGLGGDGTLNEIANGLLLDGPNPNGPILAAIPGGNGNVFIRNMGMSKNPIVASQQLISAVAENQIRTIGVGKIATENITRWFLFNAGIGLDAAVLAQMEARRDKGKRASDAAYAGLALRELLRTDRKNPALSLVSESGQIFRDAYFALLVNLAPWAYLGTRPLNPLPQAGHDTALDFYAPTALNFPVIVRLIRRALAGNSTEFDSDVITLHNQNRLHIKSDRMHWIQVDGDVVTQSNELTAIHVPEALRVLTIG